MKAWPLLVVLKTSSMGSVVLFCKVYNSSQKLLRRNYHFTSINILHSCASSGLLLWLLLLLDAQNRSLHQVTNHRPPPTFSTVLYSKSIFNSCDILPSVYRISFFPIFPALRWYFIPSLFWSILPSGVQVHSNFSLALSFCLLIWDRSLLHNIPLWHVAN